MGKEWVKNGMWELEILVDMKQYNDDLCGLG